MRNIPAVQTTLFANGSLGEQVAVYLHERGELDALVLHPEERRRWTTPLDAFSCPSFVWPVAAEALPRSSACMLSVLFGYLLPSEILGLAQWRAVNLHPGFLPWNRGADPNVWPLVDGSPAGTTLHVMTDGLDAGPILAQRQVRHEASDTAESLYERLMVASIDLFTATWPQVADVEPVDQPAGGSHHRRADLRDLDLTSDDLPTLDKLRARTFGPYGAEFSSDDARYRVQVSIQRVG